MAEVGNWTVEQCSTEGTGDLILIGTDLGYARWRDSIAAGTEVYYSIQDGINRETGIGTFNGVNTITRDTVTATLLNNVYDDSSPTAIPLSGSSIVSCSLNKKAFDVLVDAITANATAIALKASTTYVDAADALIDAEVALKADKAYVDIADALAVLLDGSRVMTGNLIVGDGVLGNAVNEINIRTYGSNTNTHLYMLRQDETKAAGISFLHSGNRMLLRVYDVTGSLDTSMTINTSGVTSSKKVSAASLHATDGATGTFTTVDSKTVTVTDGIITDIT